MENKMNDILLRYFKTNWKLIECKKEYINKINEQADKKYCFVKSNDMIDTIKTTRDILLKYTELKTEMNTYKKLLKENNVDVSHYTTLSLKKVIPTKQLEEMYLIEEESDIIRVDSDIKDVILTYEDGVFRKIPIKKNKYSVDEIQEMLNDDFWDMV